MTSDSIENILLENLKNQDVVFVFSTDVVKNSWVDWLVMNPEVTGVNAVPLERFTAWDNFKSDYITAAVKGKCAVPSVLKKLFVRDLIRKNAEKPEFKKIIAPEFAEKASAFTEWICKALPSLDFWHKRYSELIARGGEEAEKQSADFENQDYEYLYKEYSAFLDKNDMFEPSWVKPDFSEARLKFIVFYPEIYDDYADYVDILESNESITVVNLPEADGKTASLRCHQFADSRQELRRTALNIRRLVEEGKCNWNEIALSVPSLEIYRPYIEREFSKYCIPYVVRAGSPLTKNCAGQIFDEINECVKNDFSYATLRTLMQDEYLPWKQTVEEGDAGASEGSSSGGGTAGVSEGNAGGGGTAGVSEGNAGGGGTAGVSEGKVNLSVAQKKELLVRLGNERHCVCNFTDSDNKKFDVWNKALYIKTKDDIPGTECIPEFYKEIRDILKAIVEAKSFVDIEKNWSVFKEKFLDVSDFSTASNQILGRCITELHLMREIEEEYCEKNGIILDSHYDFFLTELQSKSYTPQNSSEGVNVYPYRLSSMAKFKYQFIIDASQDNLEIPNKRLAFLSTEKRQALGLLEEDKKFNPSKSFIRLYTMHSNSDEVQFSFSEDTFNGFAIAHTYLDVIENEEDEYKIHYPLKELDSGDFYLNETKRLLHHQFKKEPVITKAQKEQFSHWANFNGDAKADTYAPLSPLKEAVNSYLIYNRSDGWEESAALQKIDEFDKASYILSQTDMKNFFPCQRYWLFNKVLGLTDDTLETGLIDDFTIGNINHKVLEEFMKYHKEQDIALPITNSQGVFDDEEEYLKKVTEYTEEAINFADKNLRVNPLGKTMLNSQKEVLIKNLMDCLHTLCAGWVDKSLGFGGFKVLETEGWKAGISETQKVRFTGRIDCVLASPDSDVFIVDFKTGKAPAIKNCKLQFKDDSGIPVLDDFQMPMYITIYNFGKNEQRKAENALFFSLKEDKSTVIVSSTAIKIGKDSVSIQDYESTLKLFDEYALLFSDKVKDGLFEPLTIPDNPAESVTFEKCKACGYKKICRQGFSIGQKQIRKVAEKEGEN